MRITFHGAARQVTGSAHLLEINGTKILLDCGLFDSDRTSPDSANRRFSFDPAELDAVIVSHAHNDHIGRLPLLMRKGFSGPVFATPATADVTSVMLRDSARIQREEARNQAPHTDGTLFHEPLFELPDVDLLLERLRPTPYDAPVEIADGTTLTYRDAGHILGSALVQIDFREDGRSRRFVFTGDLGRRDMGLLANPRAVRDIDILVSESTYGGKELDPYHKLIKQLHAIVARATRLQSRIIIPAFSLGRTQRMVYCLLELFRLHKVPPIPVFVDSPLALRLTHIHREYPEAYTATARRVMEAETELFSSDWVNYCATWEDSRRLNSLTGPMIVIASSGMCEAGRIRHHLRHAVENPNNAIVIVSYQAEGTLGRKLADGVEKVQIMDRWQDLNAAVYVLDGFSGHADRNDLEWWYSQSGGNIEKAFLVHGEPASMEALAPLLQPHVKSEVIIPELLQSYEV